MDDLPEIDNGYKEMQRGTRGSVFKYKCNPKFKLFGYDGPISCLGYKQWSAHETPVCTRKYSRKINLSGYDLYGYTNKT